jgi:hypothetical protein
MTQLSTNFQPTFNQLSTNFQPTFNQLSTYQGSIKDIIDLMTPNLI